MGQARAVTVIGGSTIAVASVLLLFGANDAATVGAGLIPARLTGIFPDDVVFGPLQVPAPVTLITTLIVHGGFLHLGLNMMILFYLGRQVEQVIGGRLFALLYLLSGLAGSALTVVTSPASPTPTIGASGAISGIIATYALLYSQQKVSPIGGLSANLVRALWLGATWIGIQLLIGYASSVGAPPGSPGIGIWAHIGGFIAGLALTRPILRYRFGRRGQH